MTADSPCFPQIDGRLHVGNLPLQDLADQFGTPLFVYDGDRIKARLAQIRAAFAPLNPLIAYSVKSNANLQLLTLLAKEGAGADIVSGGELFRALKSGCPANRIVFAGVGKTTSEMELGLSAGIRAFHVESRAELELLARVAGDLGTKAPLGIRANLDIESPTPHAYTRTGHLGAKFGVDLSRVGSFYEYAIAHPHLDPIGLDVHIGSQIRDIGPFIQALDGALELVDGLEADHGLRLDYLDLGGGYGVSNGLQPDLDIATLGREVCARFEGRREGLVLEPGRFLTADAGCLLTSVLFVKRAGKKTFVITDAGMTELIRPSHYGGRHPIAPVVARPDRPVEVVDVVGPVCETGDFLALDRELPIPEEGEVLWVGAAGAYGFAMASNYNSRLRPAEVLVEDGLARLARRRETFEDLVRNELDL